MFSVRLWIMSLVYCRTTSVISRSLGICIFSCRFACHDHTTCATSWAKYNSAYRVPTSLADKHWLSMHHFTANLHYLRLRALLTRQKVVYFDDVNGEKQECNVMSMTRLRWRFTNKSVTGHLAILTITICHTRTAGFCGVEYATGTVPSSGRDETAPATAQHGQKNA